MGNFEFDSRVRHVSGWQVQERQNEHGDGWARLFVVVKAAMAAIMAMDEGVGLLIMVRVMKVFEVVK